MSKPPKIDRKTLKTPDQFVKQGRHVLEVFVGHQATLIGIIAALVLTISGWYLFQWQKSSQLEKGWKRYGEALKTPEAGRWEELKKVHSEFGNSRATEFAATALADHFFDESRKQALKDPKTVPADANSSVEWYTKALSFTKLTPTEKGLLLINRAGAYEMGKKLDDAMKDYEEAAALGLQVKPLALLGQGHIFELKNNKAKAIETYEKVSADFLNSEFSRMAKNYLRRLKSPLLSESNS